MQNAKLTPPEEKLTRAIAKVTGGNAEELIWCAYIVNAPDELKVPFKSISEEVFNPAKNEKNSNIKFDVVYKENNLDRRR